MDLEENVAEVDDEKDHSWTLCVHAFNDLTHVSPVVFVYLLKESYFYGMIYPSCTANICCLREDIKTNTKCLLKCFQLTFLRIYFLNVTRFTYYCSSVFLVNLCTRSDSHCTSDTRVKFLKVVTDSSLDLHFFLSSYTGVLAMLVSYFRKLVNFFIRNNISQSMISCYILHCALDTILQIN